MAKETLQHGLLLGLWLAQETGPQVCDLPPPPGACVEMPFWARPSISPNTLLLSPLGTDPRLHVVPVRVRSPCQEAGASVYPVLSPVGGQGTWTPPLYTFQGLFLPGDRSSLVTPPPHPQCVWSELPGCVCVGAPWLSRV